MRVSAGTAALIAAAAAAGWFVRGIDGVQTSAPIAQPVAIAEEPLRATTPAPPAFAVHRAASPSESRGGRNLFAYREREARRESIAVPHLIVPAVEVRPVIVDAAPPPAPPPFPYRLIGVFGTHRNRIAAFARDGEVRTVRTGERIDGDFVLRSIGIESVVVGSAAGGEQRLPLGAAGATGSADCCALRHEQAGASRYGFGRRNAPDIAVSLPVS